MNKFTTITSLIFYLIFTQVYPVLHVHAHEHHGEIEFQISLHPPELPFEQHEHEDDHHDHEHHEHDETHFQGSIDYTIRSHKLLVKDILQVVTPVSINIDEQPVLTLESTELPLRISPSHWYAGNYLRGPPNHS